MKTYPAYKSSGVEWLGEIPEHWKVVPLKRMVRINPESLGNGTNPDYAIRYVDIGNVNAAGQIVGEEKYRFENAPSRARRIVRDGDVIVSTVRTYLKAIAYMDDPPVNRVVSTGFAVLRPTAKVHPRFLGRLTSSPQFVGSVVANSQGVSYPAINTSALGGLPVWLPPLPEQQALAAYLDRKTQQIDALLAKKERLIALLKEQRAAVIARAVTKGLDPDAEMKDSGVAWLGAVPRYWSVGKLKFLLNQIEQGWSPQCEKRQAGIDEWGVLKVGCVNGKTFDETEHKALPTNLDPQPRYEVQAGDLLMSRANTRELVGSVAVVGKEVRPRLLLCDKLYRLDLTDGLIP